MKTDETQAPEAEAPQDTRNIYQRLLDVMKDVKYIQKQSGGTGMRFPAVMHDDVVAKVRPALIKHGVYCFTTVDSYKTVPLTILVKGEERQTLRTEVELRVVFVNVDDPDDRHEVSSVGYMIDPGDKSIGGAISYGKKYGVLIGLFLETGVDPDQYQDEIEVVPQTAEDEHEAEFKAERKRLYAKCVTAAKDLSGDAKETVAKWMTDHGHRWDTVTLDALGICLDKMKADAMTEPEGMDAEFEATTE